MVSVGEVEQFTLGFRLLVIGLIGLGMAGFGAALLASSRLSRTLSVLVGASSQASRERQRPESGSGLPPGSGR